MNINNNLGIDIKLQEWQLMEKSILDQIKNIQTEQKSDHQDEIRSLEKLLRKVRAHIPPPLNID